MEWLNQYRPKPKAVVDIGLITHQPIHLCNNSFIIYPIVGRKLAKEVH
jgi:hypothetical protein